MGEGGKVWTCQKHSMERVIKCFRECAGCNASKRRAGLETCDVEADLAFLQGKLALLGKRATGTQQFHRGSDDGTYTTRSGATRETPSRGRARDQPEACEGQTGRGGESDGLIVLGKPGNAGGGKEPSFKSMWKVVKEGRLGNLETPPSVRKIQNTVKAKAKAEY